MMANNSAVKNLKNTPLVPRKRAAERQRVRVEKLKEFAGDVKPKHLCEGRVSDLLLPCLASLPRAAARHHGSERIVPTQPIGQVGRLEHLGHHGR